MQCYATLLPCLIIQFIINASEDSKIVKRHENLCKYRSSSQYFRLSADGDCRDVGRCSRSAELHTVKCPAGLAFDIEKQKCELRVIVTNCNQIEKSIKPKSTKVTDKPVCLEGKLPCADSECLDRALFCDGKFDCKDESDESECTDRAGVCNTLECVLPDCFCSEDGKKIPGDLHPSSIPQMVVISFDGAINIDNIDLYFDIFHSLKKTRKNPNGCTIKGTFFISHKYSNYSAVQELHRRGHEIAVHSLTNRNDMKAWTKPKMVDWLRQMAGSRLIIEKFANITDGSVIGMRTPYLRVGGYNQFHMMEDQGFVYDSSIIAPLSNPPLWPYSLQFRMPHRCLVNSQNCPSRSHNVWEMIINEMDQRDDPSEELPGCVMVDSCSNIKTSEQLANFLRNNFNRHYNTNKAPFGLYFHSSWLKKNQHFLQIFTDWIDKVLQEKNDVYFVTMKQVIQWMQDPVDKVAAEDFSEWKIKCDIKGPPSCRLPNACSLTTKELPGERLRLDTCMRCPQYYPWLEDPTGAGFD